MAVRYPAGYDCPHCLWVLGKNPRMKPFFSSVSDRKQDFLGLTVFDSHGLYENSFNCVSGEAYGEVIDAHKYFNFGSALKGTIDFIAAISEKYRYNGRIRISMSSYNNPKVGQKEHPHVWVTINDKNFWKQIDSSDKQAPKKLPLKPYADDTVIELSGEQCYKLIYGDNSEKFIVNLLSKKLCQQFNPNRGDFFIFIDYENGRFMGGQLATNLKPRASCSYRQDP